MEYDFAAWFNNHCPLVDLKQQHQQLLKLCQQHDYQSSRMIAPRPSLEPVQVSSVSLVHSHSDAQQWESTTNNQVNFFAFLGSYFLAFWWCGFSLYLDKNYYKLWNFWKIVVYHYHTACALRLYLTRSSTASRGEADNGFHWWRCFLYCTWVRVCFSCFVTSL